VIAPPTPGTTRVWLIRHGEPEVESHGRCYGRLDVGLSPLGRAQAARTAALLDGVPLDAIYASPRRRALASAEPIATPRGLEVRVDERLRELDFGALEGLTYDQARERHPAFYAAWMATPTTVTFPDGESYALLRTRVLAALAAQREAHAGRSLALVAHGGVTRTVIAAALGLADAHIFRLAQDYAALSAVDYFDGTAVLRLLNATT